LALKRRLGSKNAATRSVLMDATEAVMRDEGYAAVTSRRVAERAGVNQQTVYYYFETMDDMLLATYRRRIDRNREALEQALSSDRPLHALWQTLSDPYDAALTMEYLALSNHNEAIRRETVEFGESSRLIALDDVTERLGQTSPEPDVISSLPMIMAVNYIARFLGFEATLGIRGGHKEVRLLVEWCLRQLEPVGTTRAPR